MLQTPIASITVPRPRGTRTTATAARTAKQRPAIAERDAEGVVVEEPNDGERGQGAGPRPGSREQQEDAVEGGRGGQGDPEWRPDDRQRQLRLVLLEQRQHGMGRKQQGGKQRRDRRHSPLRAIRPSLAGSGCAPLLDDLHPRSLRYESELLMSRLTSSATTSVSGRPRCATRLGRSMRSQREAWGGRVDRMISSKSPSCRASSMASIGSARRDTDPVTGRCAAASISGTARSTTA